jgi:NAD(P)-dependent dehydrogenase (short-subunit alcohol dehydrogenase family)
MAGRLEGKVAIITGGNSGIGEGTVRVFAREGARVVLMARREDEGKRVEADVRAGGGTATFVRCDVMKRASIDAAVAAAVAEYGRIDIVFNNAGGGFPGEFPKESDDAWEQTLSLNLTGTFRMSKACWPHLIAAGDGAIVNMSSYAAVSAVSPKQRELLPFVPPAAYSAAKAGVEAFTRYAASQGSPHGIRVNCVRPGQILAASANIAPGEHFAEKYFASVQLVPGAGTPEDVANAVLFLASDESRFVNGEIINIDGGASGKI